MFTTTPLGDGDVLGEGAVAAHADDGEVVALVDGAALALGAAAAGEVGVGGDALADAVEADVLAQRDDRPRELVARRQREAGELVVAVQDVQVGAADAGAGDLDQHLAGPGWQRTVATSRGRARGCGRRAWRGEGSGLT
jgi:hypothetical protein